MKSRLLLSGWSTKARFTSSIRAGVQRLWRVNSEPSWMRHVSIQVLAAWRDCVRSRQLVSLATDTSRKRAGLEARGREECCKEGATNSFAMPLELSLAPPPKTGPVAQPEPH